MFHALVTGKHHAATRQLLPPPAMIAQARTLRKAVCIELLARAEEMEPFVGPVSEARLRPF